MSRTNVFGAAVTLVCVLGLGTTALGQSRPRQRWVRHEPDPRTLSVYVSDVEERASSRLFYWNAEAQRSAGEIHVSYGAPAWNEGVDDAMETLKDGLTWRFGNNFWTVLDTSLPLRIGDVELSRGSYYLGVDRSADGESWSLAILDPELVRNQRIDPYETHVRPMPVASRAPLRFTRLEAIAEKLQIVLDADEADPQRATLEVRFGPYRLETDIEIAERPAIGK